MKFKKTKIASLALAGVLVCGSMAGCSLVTTNSSRDLLQVVAEVDISKGELFTTGEFQQYASSIDKTEILKRDLIANFASYGSTYVNSYGMSVEATYETLMNSLVSRAIYLQYAQAYFFKNGFTSINEDGSEEHATYTLEGYNSAISSAAEGEKEVAGLAYFLNEEERAAAEYQVRLLINNTLDAQEEEVIEGNHTHDHSSETVTTTSSRTTPTGVDTVDEDYYDSAYKIYLGTNSASDCGSYETQDKSTPATRKKAYKTFLANLSIYGLIEKGENTSDIESLSYYQFERKNQYESAVIEKLDRAFEYEAEKEITEDWITNEKFDKTLKTQMATFSNPDNSELKSALDGASDSSFVLYAPDAYGYVINILLPFSAAESQELEDADADFGDKKGNKFALRADILKTLTAIDQRSAWFEADYAFEAEETDNPYGENGRNYLFFENNLRKSKAETGTAQYDPIKNYYGSYTYNGVVSKTEKDGETKYSFKPNKLTIDDFLAEMESYLGFAGLTLEGKKFTEGYFDRTYADYYDEKGDVDYSRFVYYKAKISQLESFDANKIFVPGSVENKAMSVINELSFAYNTDTAGLNSYLGYTVVPTTTDFVDEFEFAAQLAVSMGAGAITVAPSQYGWHIMYCTFSYANNPQPYTFDWSQIREEGTFSNLYYEALKADNLTSFSSDNQRGIINDHDKEECVKIYEERYKDRYTA